MRGSFSLALSSTILLAVSAANAQEVDWKKVDAAIGRSAAVSGDVHRYAFPRSDLQVTLDGVAIKPGLALGGWTAFKPMHGGVMIMGDLVLLDTEISPVMAKLIEGGLEVTAVHNHLLRSSPATYYLHVGGHGDPEKVAAALHVAWRRARLPSPRRRRQPPPAVDLDTAQLDQIMGVKGTNNGGIYRFTVPRRDAVTEDGMPLTPAGPLGVAAGDQLPAHRRRQGRHHGRSRPDRRRGQSGDQGACAKTASRSRRFTATC